MASEVLSVPEEHLREFIEVLKAGMAARKDSMPEDMRIGLTEWIEDCEEYLKED